MYVAFVYAYRYNKKLDPFIVTLSHFIPSMIAVVMFYILIYNQGASTAQFVAGSDEGFKVWSTWVNIVIEFCFFSFGNF